MSKTQHILFILDRSGSMQPQANDVIGGFNGYLERLRNEAKQDGLQTRVSLVTFAVDDTIAYSAKPLEEIPLLTTADYQPSGGTALLDAFFANVTKYREMLGQGDFGNNAGEVQPVLVIVFTDGEENSSRLHGWRQVQDLIGECEALGNWTFAYVGAHASAWSQSEQMSVKRGNVLSAPDMPMPEIMDKVAVATIAHRKMVVEAKSQGPAQDLFVDNV